MLLGCLYLGSVWAIAIPIKEMYHLTGPASSRRHPILPQIACTLTSEQRNLLNLFKRGYELNH